MEQDNKKFRGKIVKFKKGRASKTSQIGRCISCLNSMGSYHIRCLQEKSNVLIDMFGTCLELITDPNVVAYHERKLNHADEFWNELEGIVDPETLAEIESDCV